MLKKKKRAEQVEEKVDNNKREVEIMKAVAQAWYNHGGSSRPLNEFDARKTYSFRGSWPSRFKLEAMKKRNKNNGSNNMSSSAAPNNINYYCNETSSSPSWDFGQSLWDSYEIVTVSKRLETGLVLDSSFSEIDNNNNNSSVKKSRTKESKNSLRNLFNQMSSRRFAEPKQNNGL
ncbi:hypothetical protein G4B88_028428 [Cannabis sativa]|uniref:Uncharacterized protein n=1 Tax=Cannabis sativa TaxID=3483 RepID=A0A7J6F124_CANSA|nr:hypothetical protein G4B88_028428 [Cannabis sativa]